MIIDFHTHCFADDIAARAVSAIAQAADIPARSDGTVSGIRTSMKTAGIDKSVLLSIATKPHQTSKINQWAISIQDNDLIPFGTIHPDFDDWKNELLRLQQAGIKGIKFHPDYQKFYVDDPRMFPVYEMAAQLGLIIIFHAGVDLGLPEPYHCPPQRMRQVVRAFPGAKLVAAHMGGYQCWDDVERYLVGEAVYLDTSFSLRDMSPEQFLRILSGHGAARLLFASDSPWGSQSEEVERMQTIGLQEPEMQAILGGNAAKLLGIHPGLVVSEAHCSPMQPA